MSDGYAVAKVLIWLMRSRKPEVVNHSKDDNISVHGHIVSIKYVYFLSSPAEHKKSLNKQGLERFLSNFVV